MTRADKIMEYVKERYGVELSYKVIDETSFTFRGCDGFECPESCIYEEAGWEHVPDCSKCKYDEFWEQEDKDNLYTNENIYKELINTQELIFKIMPVIYDLHVYIKSIDKNIEALKGENNGNDIQKQ